MSDVTLKQGPDPRLIRGAIVIQMVLLGLFDLGGVFLSLTIGAVGAGDNGQTPTLLITLGALAASLLGGLTLGSVTLIWYANRRGHALAAALVFEVIWVAHVVIAVRANTAPGIGTRWAPGTAVAFILVTELPPLAVVVSFLTRRRGDAPTHASER